MTRPPALWAGIEPTVSRVGDMVLDQQALCGTDERPEDMDRLADLGASAVRLALLWERTAPQGLDRADWRWADQRLARLKARGVQPIAGLVHHGGGPRHTHLLDPEFVPGLVAYARAVARRYPDLAAYTPVNEPLTTARFSGLYGHWYPHGRDERSCWLALKHQLQATVLAMQAIREINPQAQLIQTEDLGRTHSTPHLQAQADFENERRWLTFDLLLGRVTRDHPLWGYLRWSGATEDELLWFADHPCAPDVLGLNVYVTGERFLDERLARYPACTHGGNGREHYADVEAVRVLGAPHGGPRARLLEAHARYGRPLAITEVHLNCTREEQLRWFWAAWQGAQGAQAQGADVRAVTAWAAFGAFEWNSLLTRREGHYESGLWDVRAPQPRPTALAQLARALAHDAPVSALALSPGWWARAGRLLYPPQGEVQAQPAGGPPLLIVGAGGPLDQTLRDICAVRGLPTVTLNPHAWAGLAPAARAAVLGAASPWAVVNLPGGVVGRGAARLASACAAQGLPLLSFSGAGVFGRAGAAAHAEHDPVAPADPAARQLAQTERWVLARCPQALVVRAGALFGTGAPQDSGVLALGAPSTGGGLARDLLISPVYAPDLLHEALNLLLDGERGVWHLTHGAPLTTAAWQRALAGWPGQGTGPALAGAAPTGPALSVPDPALRSERGWPLPPLAQALERWWASGPEQTPSLPCPPAPQAAPWRVPPPA
ncbi:family 1 glycosylhydrolase [Deinococcus arcticus]|uniref:dTDP-4-dehydrorhamnose reductase n=1 Tax=Deinococcus arcticus TaxID=2136176 RepID=A0A2T3W5T3_9DEIO|nr:family 1 glycosylhydrolase [Deinococcus arcticus]PTA67239.1 dTDP-4-dehydrorhamnose reductase [Deinococcus arcticus]